MSATTHGPVVVGIDGTAEARTATEIAAWEADRRKVALRLVYAHRPTPLWGPATPIADDYGWEAGWVRDLLRTAKKEAADRHPGLTVETAAVYGGPAAVLVSESDDASLVVVGTRAYGGVRGRLAGSTAAQVAAHASAPVIVARTTEAGPADPDVFIGRPVLVGVDGSEESLRAFAFAVEEAVARQAPLHAVFVWDMVRLHDVESIEDDAYDVALAVAKAERLLTEATSGWSERYPELTITRTAVRDLDPVATLSDLASGAGLAVVGSRGHGGFLGLRLGSTVDGLIRQSPVPVAVVRGTVDAHR